jgi:uncharacterized protein involved in exopolysaccharide biosynthesis
LTLLISFVLPSEYRAESALIPQAAGPSGSELAGLAAQFGVRVGSDVDSERPEFYAALLTSREFLQDAVLTTYRFPIGDNFQDTLEGTLVDIYGVRARTPKERTRRAIRVLKSHVTATASLTTGIVTLRTTAQWPELAERINRRLLKFVNDFNLEKRQSRARMQRHFVEERLEEAQGQLQEAEGTLRVFHERNRQYRDSPLLILEAARLQRRVDQRQEVVISLVRGLDEARIDEVRNTPVVPVVTQPEGSARSAGRGPIMNAILGLMVGGVLSVVLVWTTGIVRAQRRSNYDDYTTFRDLATDTIRALPRPLSRLLRRLAPEQWNEVESESFNGIPGREGKEHARRVSEYPEQ